MGKSNTSNNYTEFFYKAFRNVLLISIPLVIISALVLSLPHSSASTDQIEFSLSVSCTMSSVVNSAHTKEITNGTYHSDVGKTTITALCNDGNGYTVYATGYSNDEVGNNKLVNTTNSQYSIDTGLATSGLTSTWAMKLNNLENDPSSTPPIIESAYDDTYGLVPNNWTKVASRPSGTTDMNLGSSFTTTYSIYTSSSQYAGTYQGQVKYVLTHPNSNAQHFFMQNVAEWKEQMLPHEGDSIQAIDQRDGKKYWVTRLADGNVWMTQNLDLDLISDVNAENYVALTSNNTDLSTDESVYTASNTIYALKGAGDTYGYTYENGIATWIPERTTIAYNQLNNTNWQNSKTDPYSWDRLETSGTNAGQPVHPDTNVPDEHGLAGNYYNWTASLASNDSTNATGNPTNSICPKGWRLTNVTNKEFGNLLVQYNIISTNTSSSYIENVSSVNSMGASPLYFVRGGYVNGGSLIISGSDGSYWFSTFYGSSNAYGLYYNSSNVLPQGNGNRSYGRSVRCLAR